VYKQEGEKGRAARGERKGGCGFRRRKGRAYLLSTLLMGCSGKKKGATNVFASWKRGCRDRPFLPLKGGERGRTVQAHFSRYEEGEAWDFPSPVEGVKRGT